MKTKAFKIEIGTKFNNKKQDLIITDREIRHKMKHNYLENQKWYKYTCNKCGWNEGWAIESNLIAGFGCPICCGIKVEIGINDMWTTNPELAKLLADPNDGYKYTQCANKKLDWKCSKCGEIIKSRQISQIRRDGIPCPNCTDGMSYPEKVIYNVLSQFKLDFDYQKSFRWSNRRLYDFYFELNDKYYIIETDGYFHYAYNRMSGQTAYESKIIDYTKDQLANSHGIDVIRIDCLKSDIAYIKDNILNSKLAILFDFSHIDWEEVQKFALNSLVQIACELKNKNSNLTTEDIGKELKLHRNTVSRYLKTGTKLGWCNYDVEKEKINGNKKSVENSKISCSKRVEVFKDSISLGVFKSANELERNSMCLFGTFLDNRNIASVCVGKRKTYKGYIFKHV